jgi:hypothetical protein
MSETAVFPPSSGQTLTIVGQGFARAALNVSAIQMTLNDETNCTALSGMQFENLEAQFLGNGMAYLIVRNVNFTECYGIVTATFTYALLGNIEIVEDVAVVQGVRDSSKSQSIHRNPNASLVLKGSGFVSSLDSDYIVQIESSTCNINNTGSYVEWGDANTIIVRHLDTSACRNDVISASLHYVPLNYDHSSVLVGTILEIYSPNATNEFQVSRSGNLYDTIVVRGSGFYSGISDSYRVLLQCESNEIVFEPLDLKVVRINNTRVEFQNVSIPSSCKGDVNAKIEYCDIESCDWISSIYVDYTKVTEVPWFYENMANEFSIYPAFSSQRITIVGETFEGDLKTVREIRFPPAFFLYH